MIDLSTFRPSQTSLITSVCLWQSICFFSESQSSVCHIIVCIHLYSLIVGMRKGGKTRARKSEESWDGKGTEGGDNQNESQAMLVLLGLN